MLNEFPLDAYQWFLLDENEERKTIWLSISASWDRTASAHWTEYCLPLNEYSREPNFSTIKGTHYVRMNLAEEEQRNV